ncbi:DUF4176 domain-containing protein [Clostridium sp. MCC353]|uniref:DUF4176 domain-containing protein n=1 Tax=Clostridium sp. MCC353 TaxID=2592646 RepID=UPI00207A5BC2|nr:DUF4176 domain-containing protein [Clostridium sp. MCC353]
MIKDLLPIGSVILLKNAKKKLMIYGIKQLDSKNPEVEYDYIGVFYPEGNMGPDYQFLFNHEDIEKVYFEGYQTEERETFIREIAKAYNE